MSRTDLPMTVAPPTDADARFDRTIDRWFRDQLALRPETATFFGIHDRDGELSPGGRDAVEAELAFYRRTIDELSAIDPSELTSERGLDRDLAIHQARLGIFWIDEYRPWTGRSGGAEHIGEALFPLFTRDFARLEERLASIASRLEQAPRYLSETRERVTAPVRLWTEIDLESTGHLPGFLDTILAAGRAEGAPAALLDRLDRAVARTKEALEAHADWLRSDVLPRADAEWALGPERFEEMVRLRELEADGDEILAVGEELLATEKAAREAVVPQLAPGGTPADAADQVKNDHATTFAESLDEYRRAMDRARAFVVEHDIATLPEEDHLNVIETPSFIRHLVPFAAYYEPAKFDPSPECAEGWAFYCERMMKEAGFEDTAEGWYVVHTDAIWRAVRIILDVQLHRGVVDVDGAVDRLVAETGFERPAAVAEVRRYTGTPTYQLSYLFGRHMIERLRDDVAARQGSSFSTKRFHDTLLYGGTMPVSYARRLFERNGR
jgi:uncharacterized protein (DUF885 family)